MAKVITFSRKYPAYHPRKGEPTFFVEKILHCLPCIQTVNIEQLVYDCDVELEDNYEPKGHTIRKGKRWKTGDLASLRFWSDKRYNSPQVIFSVDLPIRVFDVEMCLDFFNLYLRIEGKEYVHHIHSVFAELAKNDGLSTDDFNSWFGDKPFSGQIICWDESIKYPPF